MKFISVVLLGFFTFFMSCRELPEQINSPFQENWSGDYQGAENGTFTFKITPQGNIVGSKISTSNNYSEEFLGYIFADGEFSCNTRNGFLFKGKITDVNAKIYSGNWTPIISTIRLFKELSLLRRIKSKFLKKIKTAQNFERFIFYISLSA